MSQNPLTAVPWVQVQLSDIQNARPGGLVAAFQGTALAPGQPDPTLSVIQKVTAELLGAIGFSGRYVMDASQGQTANGVDVIPPNCLDMTVERICRQLERRLMQPWTPNEITDERTWQSVLNEIRRGEYPIDATNNPGAPAAISSKGGTVATIYAPPRTFGGLGGANSSGSSGWGGGGGNFL